MNLKAFAILAALVLVAMGIGHFITRVEESPPEFSSALLANASSERGEYVVAVAGCKTCHTQEDPGAQPYAGGRPIETPFGSIFSPNITPDLETGIGAWSLTDFEQALRQGISPSGRHYFPAFPYTSYAGMSDGDVADAYAFLQAQTAVVAPNSGNALWPPFSWRYLQRYWKYLYFSEPEPALGRGAYLVEALAHCGECHTPRSWIGGSLKDFAMSGSRGAGSLAPNLTSHREQGLGKWSEGSWAFFLKTGFKPDFDDVQGPMAEVIEHSTSQMTDEDRIAIAVYFRSLPPRTSYEK